MQRCPHSSLLIANTNICRVGRVLSGDGGDMVVMVGFRVVVVVATVVMMVVVVVTVG